MVPPVSNPTPHIPLYYALASAILSLVMTKTSINGVLDRGGMFVFSTSQFREFMQIPPEWDESNKFMLDLGAGDGRVTSVIAQFYKNVAVTEASQIMEWRLGQRGYKVLPLDKWPSIPDPLHLVSALNLLDRHFDPFTLLNSKINLKGGTLEEQANSLVEQVFVPAGFELIRWGKLPYLCEGDYNRAYYKLDDTVFLLRAVAKHDVSYVQQRDNMSYVDRHSRDIAEL
ncbi:Methyltransferase-like protein 9 [Toxocara canis]|uniref:Methyltransferase-like protein 9 n=1 Tax=Toxocara canis TaxID=6265 RepID=A0A0B2VT46_TOXCA|nr:Methyltransferase-like protein 9 [Toxocara canis]